MLGRDCCLGRTPMTKHLHPRIAAMISLHAIIVIVAGSIESARANVGEPLYWVHASDGFVDDGFGFSMSVSGNMALFGATDPDYPNLHFGAAYVFDTTTGQQLRKLTPSDAI